MIDFSVHLPKIQVIQKYQLVNSFFAQQPVGGLSVMVAVRLLSRKNERKIVFWMMDVIVLASSLFLTSTLV